MKKTRPVSEIMTKQLITLKSNSSLQEADRIFSKQKVRHLPVIIDGKLLGMLSLTDLERISFVNNFSEDEEQVSTVIYEMLTIEQIMVRNVTTVTSKTTIKDVAKILSKENFHALPVVDNEELVGIVTSTDLINYLLDIC